MQVPANLSELIIFTLGNAASSCVKVRLKTQIQSGQSVVVSKLWPETDLSVVNAVTSGGIYIDGNTIGFNPATQNLVSSGGMTDWVGSHYCPLEKTIPGGTQYADMFVRGGTATVTPVPGNVGYGTLDNSWNVSTHIPAPPFDVHTSRSLPTVPAVASAIDEAIYGMTTGISGAYVKKTDYATTSTFGIVTVPVAHGLSIAGGTLGLSVAPVVGNYTDAATLVTAGNAGGVVVMNAITGAATGQEGLAVAPTVDAVYDAIDQAKGDLTVWVRNNFISNSYTPPPATVGIAGYGVTGIVSIQRYGGIEVDGNGVLTIASATTAQIGGVYISDDGSISINAGTISVAAATVYATIQGATAGTGYGGVRVISTVSEPTPASLNGLSIVPNNEAVWNAAYGYDADFTCTKLNGSITCGSGRVYINGTSTLTTISTVSGSIAVPSTGSVDVWLNITKSGSTFTAAISNTRSTTAGTQSILLAEYSYDGIPTRCHKGPVAWYETSTGGGTAYFGDFQVSCAGHNSTIVVAAGHVYLDGSTTAKPSGSTVTVACTVKGSTATAKTLWLNIPNNYTGLTATETPLMSNTIYSVPLACVLGSTVCQYQYGPVVIRGRWT